MSKAQKEFRPYATPKVKVFGSVRNLTGGSNGGDADGFSSMQMMF